MKRFAWVVALVGCTPAAPSVVGSAVTTLPPARVTTKSELVLACQPADAEVELDGVPQGTCDDFDGEPMGLPMGKGIRHVRVKKRGHLPWETVLETDGTRVMMNVTLLSTGVGTP